jgi:hypothetical protein
VEREKKMERAENASLEGAIGQTVAAGREQRRAAYDYTRAAPGGTLSGGMIRKCTCTSEAAQLIVALDTLC